MSLVNASGGGVLTVVVEDEVVFRKLSLAVSCNVLSQKLSVSVCGNIYVNELRDLLRVRDFR